MAVLKTSEFNYKSYLDGKVSIVEPKRARIRGTLYNMPYKGYPALLVEDSSTEWVYGELFELLDYESTLSQLDSLEGYYGVDHPANEYVRSVVKAEIWHDRSRIYVAQEVFVYLYQVEKDILFTKQSQVMKKGIWQSN